MKARQYYYASVSYIDDLIGQILKVVNMSNTLIVITSDHGWSLGEHSEWAKYSNFDVAVRVPLIIYDPELEITSTRTVDVITELLDIFPTLVNLTGLPKIKNCINDSFELLETCTDGKSLTKFMKGKLLKRTKLYTALSQYPRPGAYPSEHPNSDQPKLKQIKIMGYSIRDERFRYIAWIGFDAKTFHRGKF